MKSEATRSPLHFLHKLSQDKNGTFCVSTCIDSFFRTTTQLNKNYEKNLSQYLTFDRALSIMPSLKWHRTSINLFSACKRIRDI